MRLQVFLSHNGVCSRRAAADYIRQGRVKVDKRPIIEPSYSLDPQKEKVYVDGRKVSTKKKDYIILNKSRGVVTTRKDKHAQKTVFDSLPQALGHLYPVGRLDKDSLGLLILTNDGELAFRLMHPKFLVEKTYIVRINKILRDNDRLSLEKGIILDSKRTSPAKISFLDARGERRILKILIHEGKKRQIRRMLSSFGYKVVSLKRSAYGPLSLGNLAKGKWRRLKKIEIDALLKCVGLAYI